MAREIDLVTCIIIFTAVILFSFGLRLYIIRHIRKRKWYIDDYLFAIAVFSMLIEESGIIWAIYSGMGKEASERSWSQITILIKAKYFGYWAWTTSTCACKLSILTLYLRIFSTSVNSIRLFRILIVLTACFLISMITLWMTECRPISAAWNMELKGTHCRDPMISGITSAAVNAFLDIAIVASPLPLIWNLHMPTIKKLGISFIFCFGLVAVAIALWRLVTSALLITHFDVNLDEYELAFQSLLEIWFGILATNAPTLAPLWNRMWSNLRSRWDSYFPTKTKPSSKGELQLASRTFGSRRPRKQGAPDDLELLDTHDMQETDSRSCMGASMDSSTLRADAGEIPSKLEWNMEQYEPATRHDTHQSPV